MRFHSGLFVCNINTGFGPLTGKVVIVDEYLGLKVQGPDMDLMPMWFRRPAKSSECLRRASTLISQLKVVADSVYVCPRKEEGGVVRAG